MKTYPHNMSDALRDLIYRAPDALTAMVARSGNMGDRSIVCGLRRDVDGRETWEYLVVDRDGDYMIRDVQDAGTSGTAWMHGQGDARTRLGLSVRAQAPAVMHAFMSRQTRAQAPA